MILRTAAAGLTAALLLAGCGGDAQQPSVLEAATTEPRATASAQSPPAPTTSKPVVTAHADRPPTKAEMLTVIRRYYEALSQATTSLDPSLASGHSAESCRACNQQLQLIKDVRSRNWSLRVRPFAVTDSGADVKTQGGIHALAVNVTAGGGALHDEQEKKIRDYPRMTTLELVSMEREGDRWLVRSIDLLAR